MASFSSMSNSLSQSALKTIRPTKVRASVGSSTSGSSARPTRKVCAEAASEARPSVAQARTREAKLMKGPFDDDERFEYEKAEARLTQGPGHGAPAARRRRTRRGLRSRRDE